MSDNVLDSDGFQIVKRKNGAKGARCFKPKVTSLSPNSSPPEISNFKLFLETLNKQKLELKSCKFYTEVLSIIETHFANFKHLVCYGLGNFGSCLNSSYQLALLLILRDEFQSRVSIFDPVFVESEKTMLNDFGFEVLKINDEGKFQTTEKTLFYMVHCGKPLYNNLLWANWNITSLQNVAIIGNSFSRIKLVNTEQYLATKLKYVNLVLSAVTEVQIPNTFKRDDIFNDTALHFFRERDLEIKFDANVWSFPKEPQYDSDDEIIVKLKVKD